MTKEQAKERFRALVAEYGLRWTKDVPAAAHIEMAEIGKILSEQERREALGLPT